MFFFFLEIILFLWDKILTNYFNLFLFFSFSIRNLKEDFNRPARSYHLPVLRNTVVPADSAQFLVGSQTKNLPSQSCKPQKHSGVLISGVKNKLENN